MTRSTGRGTLAALAALPFTVALIADLTLFAAVRDRLPDPLATHFPGTTPDRFTSTSWFLAACVGALAGTGALFTGICAARGAFTRWALTVGYGLAGLLGGALASVLLVNADAGGNATATRMPLWHMAAAAAAGAGAAGAGWLTARALRLPDSGRLSTAGDAPVLGPALAEGEIAGWTRTVSSRPAQLLGLLMAAVGCVLLPPVGWAVAVPLLILGLLVLGASRIQVTAGPRGLTVSPAVAPWPRTRVPLAEMDLAVSRDIRPAADFGGWGYRIRPDATGVVVRSGEALVVRRTSGREFAVTVDDSATAAALLNSLLRTTVRH
ncbi:DUF1648 domain-containing protein [Streptomyces sp. NPDC050164]|uniref:DUF1648 domain-containing protein n=1 Tax=Streptomyces sp. NPDC050164 TaxID=3365605 RepID=UPI0037AE5E3C